MEGTGEELPLLVDLRCGGHPGDTSPFAVTQVTSAAVDVALFYYADAGYGGVKLQSRRGKMMIWPSITTPAIRPHLFAAMSLGEPDFIVERWHEYKWELDVKYLPKPQIDKIDAAAAQVIFSFDLVSPVVGVLVQGHADFDLRRHGSDRVQFEFDISESRAKQVEKRLKDRIGDRIVSDHQAFKAIQI